MAIEAAPSQVRSPSDSDTSRNTWFMVSATEWAASASIAAEWPISPAAALAMAMARLAARAARTVLRLSLCTRPVPSARGRPAGPGVRGPLPRAAVRLPPQEQAAEDAADQPGKRGGPGPGGDPEQQRHGAQHHREGAVVEPLDRRARAPARRQQAGGDDGEPGGQAEQRHQRRQPEARSGGQQDPEGSKDERAAQRAGRPCRPVSSPFPLDETVAYWPEERGTAMALVLEGEIATMDPARPVVAAGRVYVDDQGRIAAVQGAGEPAPAGFDTARRVRTGGVVYPGLIDLHNHLAYNCLPLWAPPGRQEPFDSREQWPRLPAYTTDVRMPTLALTQVASKAVLKYVETKAVVGGVTAIQGSAKMSRPYEGWLVRNVEFETFGSAQRSVFQSVRTLGKDDFPTARDHMANGSAFIYHLAEGTSPALVREYIDLKDNDCLQPRLVAIHATALGDPEYADWGPHGSSMVWSPLSNLWLYRHTSDVVAARRHGIRVCLGADWAPSGSKHLLGELKVADLWNRAGTGLAKAFSDVELCELVTANPADALGWSDRIGRVRPGLLADLLVLRRNQSDPHRNLIEATEHDVRLVLVGGRPVYGTPAFMRSSDARQVEPITVGGRRRSISLVDAGVPDADMTWRQVLAALEAVRRDPAGAHEQVQVTAAATGEEPLRLIPDDPGGEPPVLLTAGDLGEVQIPSLDPLAHDDAFFAALRAAPILGGLLDDLQGYYGR